MLGSMPWKRFEIIRFFLNYSGSEKVRAQTIAEMAERQQKMIDSVLRTTK